MPRRKTNHTAEAGLALGDQEAPIVDIETLTLRSRLQCGEIIVEEERRWILRIANAAGARISGAEIALGVICRFECRLHGRYLALPGARGAVRGDQHPLVSQSVAPAMRIFCEFQVAS